MGPSADPLQSRSRAWVVGIAGLLCVTAFLLHGARLLRPFMWEDDFEIVAQSFTWPAARANLWVPANEHTMPLGRISTWLMIEAAGRQSHLPVATAWHGPVAVLLGMVLVYLFVRRELGHPVYGLVAMALFGVTSQYEQAVSWFAASFAILALDTVLIALLCAQRWRQGGSVGWLVLCVVWSALAPCWFASGILAGALCTLYLLPLGCDALQLTNTDASPSKSRWNWRLVLTLVPLLGTALFLAVSLPMNAEHIMHLEHYQMQKKTAVEAFELDRGLLSTARSLVDNVLLGQVGIAGVVVPMPEVLGLSLGMVIAAAAWWWFAPSQRLVLLGLGFILVSYILTYSARAGWPYETMLVHWSRYHLFPQLGLALVLCGGLPRWSAWLVPAAEEAGVSWRVRVGWTTLAIVFVLYTLCQVPRAWSTYWTDDYYHVNAPYQQRDLHYVEHVDEACRQHGISADAARAVLPPFHVTGCSENGKDAWRLLRGSPHPQPLSESEVRQLLVREPD